MSAGLPAVFPEGRQINSGADGTYNDIIDTYTRGTIYQWGAELARNGLQAVLRAIAAGGTLRGNEQIVFDFVGFQFVDDHGHPLGTPVYKRRVWNTGPPMDPENELMEYFQSLHKGAGTNRRSRTNMGGQYGKGGRSAVLGHSDMMVMTTQPGGGTHGLIIHDTDVHFVLVNFTFNRSGNLEMEDLADFSEICWLDLGGNRYLNMVETDLVHPDVIRDGGVSTVLLGVDIFDHYIEGDQNRAVKETQRGLIAALTDWLNYPVPVRVDEIRTPKGGSRPGRQITINGQVLEIASTTLKNYDDWVARVPAGNQTCVNLTNPDGATTTTCDVYLLPEDWNWNGPLSPRQVSALKRTRKIPPKLIQHDGKTYEVVADKDQWLPGRGEGFIVFTYDDEMTPAYNRGKHIANCKDWGIVESTVAQRLGLIISPPKLQNISGVPWGVQQGVSRSSMYGIDEKDSLPVAEWGNEFYDLLQNSPDLDFLRKALEEATPTAPSTIDMKELERIQQDIQGRLDMAAQSLWVTTSVDTGTEGENTGIDVDTDWDRGPGPGPGPGPHPRSAKSKLADPNSRKKDSFIKERKVPSMPNRQWLTEPEWQAKEQGDPAYASDIFCVVERGTNTTLYFNMAHTTYVGQRNYYCTPTGWFKQEGIVHKLKKVKLVDLEQAVQDAFFTEGLSKVFLATYLATDPKTKAFDLPKFKLIANPEDMTFALGGYVNVDPHIQKRIKALIR